MRRHTVGILALVLIAIGVFAMAAGGIQSFATAACLRIGLVLGAFWLAFPQLQQMLSRFSFWVVVAGIVGIALLLVSKSSFVLIPLAVAVAVLYFVGWYRRAQAPEKGVRKE